MIWKIAAQDVREWHNEGLYHAMLCDPPYEYGFMGKSWDASGVAFLPETWAHLGQFLHPGAFGFAFAGARTYHRIAAAIEDAGYIIHPMLGWVYGSGFPKATRIDTQIDKAAGAEIARGKAFNMKGGSDADGRADEFAENGRTRVEHSPQTEAAAVWQGHRYGLQAMKPALEPIVVFQKPYRGKAVESITETGAGSLWIEGARIGTADGHGGGRNGTSGFVNGYGHDGFVASPSGRWPANFALCHSPECGDECAEGCAVAAMDRQSGVSKAGTAVRHNGVRGGTIGPPGAKEVGTPDMTYADAGTSSRFFHNAEWNLERTDPFLYCAKAGRKERDAGLDGLELKDVSYMNTHNGNPELGETWHPIDERIGKERDRFHAKVRNAHPTVKPIALTRWLATLLLPPAEYAPRRLLVPFSGVGSEMIGAALAGWDFAQGIEQSQEYVEIAEARLRYWTQQPQLEGIG